jgi:hypothetical protein
VVCDGNGMVSFDHIRYRRNDPSAFLYAFDLIELNGDDLRRDRCTREAARNPARNHILCAVIAPPLTVRCK